MIDLPVAMLLIFVTLAAVLGSHELIKLWLERRYKYFEKELEVRKLEAMSKLSDRERKLLLEHMPEWIDSNDDEEVRRYIEARKEVIGV